MNNLLLLSDKELEPLRSVEFSSNFGFFLTLQETERKLVYELWQENFKALNVNDVVSKLFVENFFLVMEKETIDIARSNGFKFGKALKFCEFINNCKNHGLGLSNKSLVSQCNFIEKNKSKVFLNIAERLGISNKYTEWQKYTLPLILKDREKMLIVNEMLLENDEKYFRQSNFVKTWYEYAEKHKSNFMMRFFSYWIALEFMAENSARIKHPNVRSMRTKLRLFCDDYEDVLLKYKFNEDPCVTIFKEREVKNKDYDSEKQEQDMNNLKKKNKYSLKSIFMSIYSVRCNLVHGEKSVDVPRDVNLIRASALILENFLIELRKAGLFDELGGVSSHHIDKLVFQEEN